MSELSYKLVTKALGFSSIRHRLVDLLARIAGHGLLHQLGRCAYRRLRRWSFSAPELACNAVVFAGDSLIDQWATLAEDFPSLKVVNRGISGDVSRELLRRFQADVLACHPRAIVILIGTNDLAGDVPPKRTAACLRRLLGLAAEFEGGAPVVLCHLLPRKNEPGRFPEKIHELNSRIDRLCAGRRGVAVCDPFALLVAEDGAHREEYFVDGLHLSRSGYRVLTAALAPYLAEYTISPSEKSKR